MDYIEFSDSETETEAHKDTNTLHIKKVQDIGPIQVWTVDGAKVRAIDNEFTNFGTHYGFEIIPENEFWLDAESDENEREFFIEHMLIEWKLCKHGKDYITATTKGSSKEKAERKKCGDLSKVFDKKGSPHYDKIHKKLLGETDQKLKVWRIDGRLVRSAFYIDFTEGGHDFVYDYVPHNEVWLDDDLVAEELPFVAIHEIHERNLMKRGWKYDDAHGSASTLEWTLRQHPEKVMESLKELGVSDPKLIENIGFFKLTQRKQSFYTKLLHMLKLR